MFDLGWSELLLIGVVALIVVGPKDLPVLFRQAGRFMGKARGMAREFSRAMEEAADESGMRDMQQTMRAAADPKTFGVDAIRDAVNGPDSTAEAERAAYEDAAAQSAAEIDADLSADEGAATPKGDA